MRSSAQAMTPRHPPTLHPPMLHPPTVQLRRVVTRRVVVRALFFATALRAGAFAVRRAVAFFAGACFATVLRAADVRFAVVAR